MNRVKYIDSLRGFAILLVVIGHLLQNNSMEGLNDIGFKTIYSFHMPLFFFVAGCSDFLSTANKTEAFSSIKGVLKMLVNKFRRILLPGVFWTLVVNNVFFKNYELSCPQTLNSYWFLTTLFEISILSVVTKTTLNRCPKLKKLLLVMAGGGFIASIIMGKAAFFSFYCVTYLIGYIVQKHELGKILKPAYASLSLVLFLILTVYFVYGESPAGNPNRIYMEIILSLLAVVPLYKFFYDSNCDSKIQKQFSYIGKYTLGIYMCHFTMVNIPLLAKFSVFLPPMLFYCLTLFLAIFIIYICIVIQKIVCSFPILRGLMYGTWK